MDVRFYHLTRDTMEVALPRLLEKVVGAGHRVLVRLNDPDDERLNALDQALWTFQAESFLPHDCAGSRFAAEQPVLLTCADENENAADVLMLLDGTPSALEGKLAMTLVMFDGRNPEVVKRCREHWKHLKEGGAALTYWQQTDAGGWTQKA